jgi:hypothetical protein
MSDDQTQPTWSVPPSQQHDIETVGPPTRPGGGSRRTAVIAVVAVVVAAVLGGGAFAAYSFLEGGGPHPEDVLPSSTIGVVSVDLDPSAGQKISAITSIRRFPALKDALGLHADDDLREFAFKKILQEGDCKGLDFDQDIKPWLGKRAALGAVDLGDADPAPVLALQVSDRAQAEKEFAAVVDCTDPEDFEFVVGDDYLIASDSAAHAKAILDDGVRHPLADDPSYQKWTGEVGDAGVLNFYVSAGAGKYFRDLVDELGLGLGPGVGAGLAGADPTAGAGVGGRAVGADPFKNFKGMAGTMRFSDGGMELAVATGGTTDLSGGRVVGPQVSRLPSDTAIALGFGVPKDFAAALVDQLGGTVAGSSGDFAGEVESETGMDLPDDLQTLLGESLTFSLGGDVPASLDSVDRPDEVPAGLLIHGDDPDQIKAVIAKIEDHLGTSLADIPLVLDASDDAVVIATSQDYADELLKSGGLGSTDRYRSAVPEVDRASGLLYLDFDSKWRDAIADVVAGEDGDDAGQRFDENTKPLKSLGISSWNDDGVTHTVVKLAID